MTALVADLRLVAAALAELGPPGGGGGGRCDGGAGAQLRLEM